MKRLLKWLARLYPAAWRNRYGHEFEALLDESKPRVRDAFDVFRAALKLYLTDWRFVRIVLPCAVSGMTIALLGSFFIPARYISQTMVTEVTNYVAPALIDDSVQKVATASVPRRSQLRPFQDWIRSSFSHEFLASEIQKKNLYPSERASMPMNRVIDKMLAAIQVRPVFQRASADEDRVTVAIQFEYPDLHVAQQVDKELVSRVMRNVFTTPPVPRTTPSFSGAALLVGRPASLPQGPAGPSRIELGLIGLLSGLLCGLLVAAGTSALSARRA